MFILIDHNMVLGYDTANKKGSGGEQMRMFIDNAAWAICSTYHTVLKASPGAAIFGWNMLFDIPFIAEWKQIREYRQHQTDLSNECENKTRVNYAYKVGDKIPIRTDGLKNHGL